MLAKCGIDKWDRFFLSSAIGKKKDTGRMYLEIIEAAKADGVASDRSSTWAILERRHRQGQGRGIDGHPVRSPVRSALRPVPDHRGGPRAALADRAHLGWFLHAGRAALACGAPADRSGFLRQARLRGQRAPGGHDGHAHPQACRSGRSATHRLHGEGRTHHQGRVRRPLRGRDRGRSLRLRLRPPVARDGRSGDVCSIPSHRTTSTS